MLFDEQDLKDRALRRIKYLEDSNYRRWSDITPRRNLEEESDYRDKKDYYMLMYYLAGDYTNNHDMEQLILMNLDNPEINWKPRLQPHCPGLFFRCSQYSHRAD